MTGRPRPKHLRLLRPFVLCGVTAGIAGSVLGFVLLERSQWTLTGGTWPLRQVHAQFQLFGFLIPLVTGFALFLVPRLAGGHPVTARWAAWTALLAFAIGTVVTAVIPFVGPGSALDFPSAWAMVLRRIDALAVMLASGCAGWALRGPIATHAEQLGGRAHAGYLWVLELALAFLVLAGLADGIGMWTSSGDPLPLLADPWARAAWRLALEGFVVGMALGVSARMFTGFLGIDPRRAFPSTRSAYRRDREDIARFWVSMAAWAVSVALSAAGELLNRVALVELAELLFAVGIVPLALRLGLAKSHPALAIDRGQDPAFPFGARSAYALLVVAALVGAIAAVCGWAGLQVSAAWDDVRRHLISLGYLMTLVATMAGRLAPGFARRPLALPWLRTTAMTAFALAAVLRIGEGIAQQWAAPALLVASAASGPVALVGFAGLFASLGLTLVRARDAG